MSSKLDQLKQMTEVVADTGDIEAIARFKPTDATTNPSLLLKAAQLPQYRPLVDGVLQDVAGGSAPSSEQLGDACDRLAVAAGCEIMKLVPGRVSTEVDARLSFNTTATIAKAEKLIALYEQRGIARERVLIKIASTWEGIRAAEQLEQAGIHCNLTLQFGFAQAAACADAGVTLISPFVGRILDWHVAHGNTPTCAAEDPGVQSVTRIYHYYKQHGYRTVVMGASFRNTGEIEQLAGCDRLTISPALLEALSEDSGPLQRQLSPDGNFEPIPKQPPRESEFRWQLNEDAMATEKLAEGIRAFAADQLKLEQLLADWKR